MMEEGLDACRREEVLVTINTARQTDLWQRAAAASRRLLESPLMIQETGNDGRPQIVRGIVDLAFEEADGWVLVDYKSDDTLDRNLDDLTAHYTPQLQAYSTAWSSLIKVKETGLLFVRSGTYREIFSCL